MITPASVGDWAMVGGLLGTLSSFATLAYRSILKESEMGTETSMRALPVPASSVQARGQLRLLEPAR
jgi:hypothetical protein